MEFTHFRTSRPFFRPMLRIYLFVLLVVGTYAFVYAQQPEQFKLGDYQFSQVGNVITGSESGTQFGRRCQVNQGATWMIVSERYEGLVHTYRREGQVWEPWGEPIAGSSFNWFGHELDLSYTGSVAAIGSESAGIKLFERKAKGWKPAGEFMPEEYGNGTGRVLSLSGNGKMISFSAYRAEAPDGTTEAGAVHVMQKKGKEWLPVINPIYGAKDQQLGYEVGVTNRNTKLVIASPYARPMQATAYKLTDGQLTQTGDTFTATGGSGWGLSTRISALGDQLIIKDGRRSVSFYQLVDGKWQQRKAPRSASELGPPSEDYGYSMDFSADGNVALVADPSLKLENGYQGVVHVIGRKGKVYEYLGYIQSTIPDQYFGYDVRFGPNDVNFSVGAISNEGAGSVVVYRMKDLKGLRY